MTNSAPQQTQKSELTAEQQAVVREPPSAAVLVTAGPGTGKTHVLIARLAELVNTHGLAPGQEMLVLTFSRAAVREIRNRLAAGDDSVRYVRARTFDSFATQLLADIDPSGAWTKLNYDERIRCAIELIRRHPDAKAQLEEFAHLLVDEVQDLVGDRAELVKVVLQTIRGGFTLLGDPAQGIYNFQLVEPNARREGSAALYKWLRSAFGNRLKDYTLTENHRAHGETARVALFAGPLLNAAEPDYLAIKEKLDTVVFGLPFSGDYEDLKSTFHRVTMPTAVLCHDNGQALMISRRLREHGIAHVSQREAVDRVLPAWLGKLLCGLDISQLGKTAFLSRAEANGYDATQALDLWKKLKRIDNRGGEAVDIAKIAERIRVGNIADEFCEQTDATLTISTIHRAKGLEFDRVIIINARNDAEDPVLMAEQTRVLYVALTRPKKQLGFLQTPNFDQLFIERNSERWIKKRGWRVEHVEIKGNDVHRDDPVGGFAVSDCDPVRAQKYLSASVNHGDPVELLRLPAVNTNGEHSVLYRIKHCGHTIGVTSEAFSHTLSRILNHRHRENPRWPASIKSLHVDAVDTVAGTSAASRKCGLGVSGIWLRVRISGLGFLSFNEEN